MTDPGGAGGGREHRAVELERRLRAADAELARVRARLDRVESSQAYQLGQVLVEVIRSPGRGAVRAPRQLAAMYGRWRRRGGTAVHPVQSPGTTEQKPLAAPATLDAGALLAAGLGVHVCERSTPVVAGVLHPRTARALGSVLPVSQLPTIGAPEILERLVPDLVLVDASATLTGPWAGVGGYSAPVRDRALLELIARATALGSRTVLWDPLGRNQVPFLHEVASFDHVVATDPARVPGATAWDPGAALGVHAAAPSVGRPWHVLTAGDPAGEPSEELVRALQACLPSGLRVLSDRGASSLPSALRSAQVGVTSWAPPWAHAEVAVPLPFERSATASVPSALVASLAAGAHVVTGGQHLPPDLSPHVTAVDDPRGLAGAVEMLLGSGPPSVGAHRDVLRALFLAHTVPVRLAELLRLVGLPEPPSERATTVLLPAPEDSGTADRIASALRDQRWRPDCVLVADDGADGHSDRIPRALGGTEVRVRTVPVTRRGAWWHELARHVDTPWVYLTDEAPAGPAHLLDRALMLEASGADGVGTSSDSPGSGDSALWRATSSLPLNGSLLARELVLSAPPVAGGLPAQRCRRGRLVSVDALPEGRHP